MESTDTSSTVPGTARATARAISDLPDAVGPTRATVIGADGSAGGDGDPHPVAGPGRDLDQVTDQVVAGRAGDDDVGGGAGGDRGPSRRGDVDEFVLCRAPGRHRRVAPGRPLHHHLLGTTDPRRVLAQGR